MVLGQRPNAEGIVRRSASKPATTASELSASKDLIHLISIGVDHAGSPEPISSRAKGLEILRQRGAALLARQERMGQYSAVAAGPIFAISSRFYPLACGAHGTGCCLLVIVTINRGVLGMNATRGANDLAAEWRDAFNAHDVDRILALYSEDVVFKSPRVRTYSSEQSGVLRGKLAVRDYWGRLFDQRPNLECTVGQVFVGVDSVALEYRFPSGLHGIEFMTVDADGLVTFAAGNDIVR